MEFYVDAAHGDDGANGSVEAPWRTIQYALPHLAPGAVLNLRGGVYRENVYCAIAGKPGAPITIRSYPGEHATLDGGMPEFFTDPSRAWTPVSGGAPGEFRSTRAYKNIRDVVGLLGESRYGLQTYWHLADLRAANELWIADPKKETFVAPVYCGPGLWYDKETGYIHVRLAHTNLKTKGIVNYHGETDPRRLPLIIAPFKSVPLQIDQASHVRFQDLTIQGGGWDTVVTRFGIDLDFENVTIYAGTYGLRASSTGPLRFNNSSIHGMIPPWAWRDENCLSTSSPVTYDPFVPAAKPDNKRNIARLNTHALLVTEGAYEFDVFYYPHNHDWEISNSEFTHGHDGVYLSGNNIRFHHNWVDSMQDDALYISAPAPTFNGDIHIYQNLITHSLMAFGGHKRGGPDGNTYIYRNIVDFRQGMRTGRPTPDNPQGEVSAYHVFLLHGHEMLGVESLYFYQNTLVCPVVGASYLHRMASETNARSKRRVFNNLCVYLQAVPTSGGVEATPKENDLQMDGNLHWSPAPEVVLPADFLDKVRGSKAAQEHKAHYPAGWETNSLVGDPQFLQFQVNSDAPADYRLQKGSLAIAHGVPLPADWEDPMRVAGDSRPDIGALPLGSEKPRFGRLGRITFPLSTPGRVP